MISLPAKFKQRYADAFGVEELNLLLKGFSEPRPVSIRINRTKASLKNEVNDLVPWCSEGVYLSERPTFSADPLWHTGVYYVQEAGSMFLSQYLNGEHPKIALDLCAAPGGKSTLLRDAFDKNTLLICNEPDRRRARTLKENIIRWGSDECIITSALPEQLRDEGLKADFILVDAPCSGEGMFRKEPRALTEWSVDNINQCVMRQRTILDAAWAMLEDGGLLIYCTCTLNIEENEGQLRWLLSRYQEAKIVHLKTSIREGVEKGVYRLSPGHTKSEGFTIFGVRKTNSEDSKMHIPCAGSLLKRAPKFVNSALGKQEKVYEHMGTWYHLSEFGWGVLQKLKGIHILLGGVPIGTEKGMNFLPDIGWVCSARLSCKLPYPKVSINKDVALSVLRRDSIQPLGQKGHYLLMYEGFPICIAKDLGNRVNTFFPKDWAIYDRRIAAADIPNTVNLLSKV